MKVAWVRGREAIRFDVPSSWLCLGARNEGKSSLLEHLAELHLAEGVGILDMFGSRDSEGLAFLRSPWVEEEGRKPLLIKGTNVDVNCSYETKKFTDLTLGDLESYDIVISASGLYSAPDEEFTAVNTMIDLIYKRRSWRRLLFGIAREGSNLFYSRLKIHPNQMMAKADVTYLLREGRHMGVSIALDTLKFTSIDIDIRAVMDYIAFKSQGMLGLPRDLWWLYSIYDPEKIRNMPKKYFLLLTRRGATGLGKFPYPQWHKRQGEDILRDLDITVEYAGEPIHEGEYRGHWRTVSDPEHEQIVRLYVEGGRGSGYVHIAQRLKRSSSTIKAQVDKHNIAIERSGFCPACRRARGPYDLRIATKETLETPAIAPSE